ncbi:MAG: hypothetical protein JWP89_4851 [Schlesneria sp.]|nr:hypothetical protein [Schlesneria sp.]
MKSAHRKFEADFLDALARKPERMNADDASSDLRQKHQDGGKWVGPLVRSLAADGLIRAVGADRSRRAARNGGLLTAWAVNAAVLAEVVRRRDAIRASLEAQEKVRPATQLTLPGFGSID